MTVKVPTVFVPGDTAGMYTPPTGRSIDRIRAITAHLQPINHNGFDRPRATPDPSVVETVTASAPPSMAAALSAAADAVGADLAQLLDSQAFCGAIMPVSPSDQAELQAVIRDHMPAPRMAVNPAQGSGGATAPGPATGSLLERMKAQAAKSLDQPLPPGSTTV